MIRTVSTFSFGLCWLLVIVGTVMYHIVIARVVPPLQDLPANIATGFGEVLRFDYMQQDARTVRDSAATALSKCGVDAGTECPDYQRLPVPGTSNTSAQRQAIVGAFEQSLSTIQRVADDRYFGTVELEQTAEELQNITSGIAQLDDSMSCAESSAIYCDIWQAGVAVLAQANEVRAELDRFESSQEVQRFRDWAPYFNALHALPYFLVVAMLFLSCYWKGARSSPELSYSYAGCTLIPFTLFWLAALTLMVVVVASGVAWKAGAREARIAQLRGDPTLAQVLEHIEAAFPHFWSAVFADLASALTAWVGASAVLLAICIAVVFYPCCLCCCRPYGKSAPSGPEQVSEHRPGWVWLEVIRRPIAVLFVMTPSSRV